MTESKLTLWVCGPTDFVLSQKPIFFDIDVCSISQ